MTEHARQSNLGIFAYGVLLSNPGDPNPPNPCGNDELGKGEKVNTKNCGGITPRKS
jgi:hypothetical protein